MKKAERAALDECSVALLRWYTRRLKTYNFTVAAEVREGAQDILSQMLGRYPTEVELNTVVNW